MNDDLSRVRDWVQDELDAEHEPPWATHRYRMVVARIDEMIAARNAAPALQLSRCAQKPASPRSPIGNIVQLDAARRLRSGAATCPRR